MNRHRPIRRRRSSRFHAAPLVAFLIIASFGILFAGCGNGVQGPGDAKVDDITFTQDDAARFQKLASTDVTGTGATVESGLTLPTPLVAPTTGSGDGAMPDTSAVLDLSMVKRYNAVRAPVQTGENVYQVTNSFVNVRAEPRSTSANVGRFNGGDAVTVTNIVDAGWAEVQMPDGKKGYVALQYLGKLTSNDKIADEKKKYAGLYYVHFAFVNVRQNPDQKSDKVGQIPGQAFVRPLSVDKGWAKVTVDGKEGYVSMDYLAPFLPKFIVRQEQFTLPILQYHMTDDSVLKTLMDHVTKLKAAGVKFMTMRDLKRIILGQESKSFPVPKNTVVLAIVDLTRANVNTVSDALYAENVPATFFLQTRNVGLTGITEKMVLTLLADGFDIESAGHSGDDLRSLTNAQVKLEVEQSRKILEDLTKADVFAIVYPQGGANERVTQIAADAGYLFGVGNSPDKLFSRDQFLRLPSYNIQSTMSAEDVLSILK